MGERKNLVFGITAPDGTEVMPKRQWLWSKDRVKDALIKGELAFLKDKQGNWAVHTKQYLKDEAGETRASKAFSLIDDIYTQHGTNEIIELFGDAQIFPFPKPSKFIKKLLEIGTRKSSPDIVLDFFAGSGSTAHAVLAANNEGSGNKQFILVQLPEKTQNPEYPTIADITRERVRRVIARLNETDAGQLDLAGSTKQDRGFRAFKLSSSNFKIWDANQVATDPERLAEQLQLYADNAEGQRTQTDILFELILKAGLPLSSKVGEIQVEGKTVYAVAEGQLLICLEDPITQEVLRGMMARAPLQILCLDAAFQGNDPLKTNTVLEAKSHGITFRTV